MPIEKSIGTPPRQIVFLVISLVVGIGSMAYVFNQIGEQSDFIGIQDQLGSSAAILGPVDDFASEISESGPFLLADPSGHSRDIYVQHVGEDPESGWSAFGVRSLEAGRDCYVEWQSDSEDFKDNCTDEIYDTTGTGLPVYPVGVTDDGILYVDLG